jgi:hypothetical protein
MFSRPFSSVLKFLREEVLTWRIHRRRRKYFFFRTQAFPILRSHAEECTHDTDFPLFEASLAPTSSKRCFDESSLPMLLRIFWTRWKTLILWFKLILCQLWLFKSHLTPVLLRLSLFWKGRKLRLNVELSNRMQPTAFGKLQKVAANRRFRVAGLARFRTRQELPRSEWPISHQFATRSASERELYATSP